MSGEGLGRLCRVFGNATRVRLVACLAREMTVSDMLSQCELSQSALSQHLALLRTAGVVQTRRDGTRIHYRLASPAYAHIARSLIDVSDTKTITRKHNKKTYERD